MGKSGNAPGVHTGMDLLAAAEVSKGMAENLLKAFEGLPDDAVLRLEIRDFGVWLIDPTVGAPMFIGSMHPPFQKGNCH